MPARKTAAALAAACLVFGSASVVSAQSTMDTARNKGLKWLLTHQNGDGSWRSAAGGQVLGGSEVTATAMAVDALRQAGMKVSYPHSAGVAWLANATPTSVDSLARTILALQPAGIVVDSLVSRLLEWRNAKYTWGTYDHFDSSFPDTPLALRAGATTSAVYQGASATVLSAACVIVAAQQGAGGWSYIRPSATAPPLAATNAILPTTANILELHRLRVSYGIDTVTSCGGTAYVVLTAIDNGIAWLLTRRNADNGFGQPGASTVFETALAYEVLRTLRPSDPATAPAANYLIARQRADGSWHQDTGAPQGDALQTALVLKVFPPPPSPLVDTDGDGIPDVIEALLGTSLTVADSRFLAAPTTNPVPPPSEPSRPASRSQLSIGVDASTAPPSTAAGDGDLNGDGIVDAADLALAERIAVGLLSPTADYLRHGDVAAPFGSIDAADVVRIRRKVLGIENF